MKTTAVYPQALRSLAAALFALLAVSCDRPETLTSQEKNSRASERREARRTEAHVTRIKTSGFDWHAGASSSYKLELGYGFADPSQEGTFSGITISGNYHFAVLSAQAGAVTVAATLSQGKVLQGENECEILTNLVNSTAAVLTLSNDGAIRNIDFPAALPAEDRKFLGAIYGWEFQMRAGTASWSARENTANTGPAFLASYTAGSNGSVTKTRNIVAGASGPELTILDSKFSAKLGPCWLDSLEGREITAISHEGNPMGESKVTISLQRSKSLELPEIIKGLLASAPQSGEFTSEPTAASNGSISAYEQIRIKSLRDKFVGVPYEATFKALAKVAETGTLGDCLPALHDLRDLLMVRPEFAPLVAESLKSGVSARLSSMLTHALELANTAATQKTLGTILNHRSDYSATVLAQAIVAAGGVGTLKDPTISEALDVIQSSDSNVQSDYPLSDAALFSLSRLAPANPELQQPLTDILTPLLSSNNEGSRTTAVLALANAELYNSNLTGLAQNLFTSEEPQTRTAALAYFEGMPELGADQIQSVARMLYDPNVPVQLQAVATLAAAGQKGKSEVFETLKDVSKNDSASEEVREAARIAVESASAIARK